MPKLDPSTHTWQKVTIDPSNDNAISTTEFLDAAEALTAIFDALNSSGLSLVKKDILQNVQKLRTRQLEAPAESETVQALVLNELKTKKHTATEGLLWLVRGLDFTCIALLRNVKGEVMKDKDGKVIMDERQEPKKKFEELQQSFTQAYSTTLKPHHDWYVRPLISAALSHCPTRDQFYPKLRELGNLELEPYLEALKKIVEILQEFQNRKEAKW